MPICKKGDVAGSYQLLRYIHGGAAGEVWIGQHALLGDYTAVKIVGDTTPLGALELEGLRNYKKLAGENSGLVPVIEFGIVPGVGYYYTMPLADNVHPRRQPILEVDEYEPMTLEKYRSMHQPMQLDRALGVALNILPSLHALHEQGFVHRDIKPDNVIRVEGRWKLCDMGLLVRRDKINTYPGTPWFAPPEGNTGRRADIHALGRTLYLLVTDGVRTVFSNLCTGLIDLPGTDDRRDAMRQVICRACHTTPGERYTTATEMRRALLPLVRKTKVTLNVNKHFDEFTAAETGELVGAVKSHGFEVDDDPLIEPGSVLVTFALPPDEAQRLEVIALEGAFNRLNVVAVAWAGTTTTIAPVPEPIPVPLGPRPESQPPRLRADPVSGRPESFANHPTAVWGSEPRHNESRGRPEKLGRYRVREEIGRGGMGVVYSASDPALDREVAIKVINTDRPGSQTDLDRFKREIRLAARVSHPATVPIFDFGEDAGVVYYVMPLLRGEPLQTRLRRGPLPAPEVIRVGTEIAGGLSAFHAMGIVHRDIKPSNVWLEQPADRVVLLDFGLAKTSQEEDQITRLGGWVGTPQYMPPEQFLGELPDPRGDVFSLGAVLYECATGRLAFPQSVERPAPNIHPPRGPLPPELAGLEELIWRLLAPDKGDRPRSAAEVADALRRISLHGEGTESR